MRVFQLFYAALGIALLVGILWDTDYVAVADRLGAVGAAGIVAVVAIYAVSFLGDSISWALILTSLPPRPVWWRRLFLIRLAGEAFNNVIPAGGFAGEPVKAVILNKRYGIPLTEATASLVMARTVNMFALIAFLIVGFVFVLGDDVMAGPIRNTAGVGLAVLSIGTLLLFGLQRYRVSTWLLRRFSGLAWAAKGIAVVEEVDARFAVFYSAHPFRLSVSSILALLNWVLGVAEIYAAFYFLDHPVTWREAWVIEALVQMVRSAVFFIPLAIGAQEGVFVLVVGAMTGLAPLGLACAAVRRIRELIWIALGLGVATVFPTSPRAPGN